MECTRNWEGSASLGRACAAKAAPRMSIAICAATSPCAWPPRPSATASSVASAAAQWPRRSSLRSRPPTRLAWTMFTQQGFLQRKDALRTLQVVQTQAPVDDLEQVGGVLPRPRTARGDHRIGLLARIGRLRRCPRQAGIHGGPDRIDIAPRSEPLALVVHLGGGES